MILMITIDDSTSDDLDVPIKVVDALLNFSVLGFSFVDLLCSMTKQKKTAG